MCNPNLANTACLTCEMWSGPDLDWGGRTCAVCQNGSVCEVLARLIEEWAALCPPPSAMTASEALRELERNGDQLTGLREVVIEACSARGDKLPDARSLGMVLRRFRGRVVGGRALDRANKGAKGVRWHVREVRGQK